MDFKIKYFQLNTKLLNFIHSYTQISMLKFVVIHFSEGTGWQHVPGPLSWISVGVRGEVWGVNG